MQLAILLTHQHRVLSLAATLDVFHTLNRYFREEGNNPFFDIHFVSDGTIPLSYPYENYPNVTLDDSIRYDLILVPAFRPGPMQQLLQENIAFQQWLRKQFTTGAEVASFCTGSFLLASAGLLNGRIATTHIDATESLSQSFPDVLVHREEIVTDSGDGVYTSGGATNSFHLKIHLIRKYCGGEKAIRIAKEFAIDLDREQQICYSHFSNLSFHNDEMIKNVEMKIRENCGDGITIDDLTRDVPTSRRNFVRRFKKATGLTPIVYLQKAKVEKAKRLLEQTRQDVMEVMINSGYNDLKSFRQVFQKHAGMAPAAYRARFTQWA